MSNFCQLGGILEIFVAIFALFVELGEKTFDFI